MKATVKKNDGLPWEVILLFAVGSGIGWVWPEPTEPRGTERGIIFLLILALVGWNLFLHRRVSRLHDSMDELLTFTAGLYEIMKRNKTLGPNEANWALSGIYNSQLLFKGKPNSNEYEDTGTR
jgi:hypothetical protein